MAHSALGWHRGPLDRSSLGPEGCSTVTESHASCHRKRPVRYPSKLGPLAGWEEYWAIRAWNIGLTEKSNLKNTERCQLSLWFETMITTYHQISVWIVWKMLQSNVKNVSEGVHIVKCFGICSDFKVQIMKTSLKQIEGWGEKTELTYQRRSYRTIHNLWIFCQEGEQDIPHRRGRRFAGYAS